MVSDGLTSHRFCDDRYWAHTLSSKQAKAKGWNKKVAPRDELRGHLMCVPLARFEPATCNIVSVPLYPISYSGTRKRSYGALTLVGETANNLWINEL